MRAAPAKLWVSEEVLGDSCPKGYPSGHTCYAIAETADDQSTGHFGGLPAKVPHLYLRYWRRQAQVKPARLVAGPAAGVERGAALMRSDRIVPGQTLSPIVSSIL
jgi:hypothetical protein